MMASQKFPNYFVGVYRLPALHSSSLGRTVCMLHPLEFGVSQARLPARLAFGAFCLAITFDDFLRVYQ
jgi:hypothetical protein